MRKSKIYFMALSLFCITGASFNNNIINAKAEVDGDLSIEEGGNEYILTEEDVLLDQQKMEEDIPEPSAAGDFNINFNMDYFSEIVEEIPKELIKNSQNTESNIFLYNESGYLINEIYPDGYVVKYQYDNGNNTISSIDTEGYGLVYQYNGKKYNLEEAYYNGKEINEEDSLKIHTIFPNQKVKAVQPTVDNYIVNGKGMNKLLKDAQFVYNASSSWTQSDIQSFLKKKNSILKNDIKVYAKKNNGEVYNTGRVITPAKVIFINARDYKINPKVILATIQKESSIITDSNVNLNRRRLFFAMGYGATYSGDLVSYTGFDKQIENGAKKLFEFYQNAPADKIHTVHEGKKITINGVTYPAKIRLSNSATWALYEYTPHVFDPKYTTSVTGGNYLFYQICDGWGWF